MIWGCTDPPRPEVKGFTESRCYRPSSARGSEDAEQQGPVAQEPEAQEETLLPSSRTKTPNSNQTMAELPANAKGLQAPPEIPHIFLLTALPDSKVLTLKDKDGQCFGYQVLCVKVV